MPKPYSKSRMKAIKAVDHDNNYPSPSNSVKVMDHDVMAGPPHMFSVNDKSNNTPKMLLKRPGLGLGTNMG